MVSAEFLSARDPFALQSFPIYFPLILLLGEEAQSGLRPLFIACIEESVSADMGSQPTCPGTVVPARLLSMGTARFKFLSVCVCVQFSLFTLKKVNSKREQICLKKKPNKTPKSHHSLPNNCNFTHHSFLIPHVT